MSKRSRFGELSIEPVSFPSTWSNFRDTTVAETQTSEILHDDVACQSTFMSEQAIQTDFSGDSGGSGSFQIASDEILESAASNGLLEFLRHIEPYISDQLERNLRSRAFDDWNVDWEETTEEVKCRHTLCQVDAVSILPLSEKDLEDNPEAVQIAPLQCTDLSWNSTGSVLAVAYGRCDLQTWCTQKGMLCTWNVDRIKINENKADVVIEVPDCLMCISFHPELPSRIVGGTYNGELILWDTASENGRNVLATSGITSDNHQEQITQAKWLSVRTGDVPKAMRISKAPGDALMGVTGLSFSCEDPYLFVVTTESGSVMKCSANPRKITRDGQSASGFAFRPHSGPVYSCDCSPFHRNLFLTAGTDMQVRLYSQLQSKELLAFEPEGGSLFCVSWSPVRPLVFGVGTGDGGVLLYDLMENQSIPVIRLPGGERQDLIYAIAFNPKRPNLMASGNSRGQVKVWSLSSHMKDFQRKEEPEMMRIAKMALD
eukprot:UC4_evm5s1456